MCAVYAYRFNQPVILVSGVPIVAVVVASLILFRGQFVPRWRLSPDNVARIMNVYSLSIGMAWFVLIGALNTVPLSEDRVGISCVNVAIICLGGTIFTLVPEAGLIFMAAT